MSGQAPGVKYLPRQVRPALLRAEAVSALAALLVFVVTALLVTHHLTQSVDLKVLHAVLALNTALGLRVAHALSFLGQEGLIAGTVFLGLVFLTRRDWAALAVTIAVMGGGEVLDNLFKAFFARPRPSPVETLIPAQVYSFPSGHAVASAAFFLLLSYLGWQILVGRWRVILAITCGGLVIAICFSRLYLGVHFLSDVVGGAALGFAWSDSVILGQQLLARREDQSNTRATDPGRG
ncbi:MAG TPA: phosphatase PAP2 family protein [Chloroflexota bacterium]|nr:phosphatase PAP2 family protein [Chloroflexota bacterium]